MPTASHPSACISIRSKPVLWLTVGQHHRIVWSGILFLVWLAAWQPNTLAQIRLPAVISDQMVLQGGQPLPIWGWAAPGEKISVTIAGQTASAQAGAEGRWQVRLPSLERQEQPQQLVVSGSSGASRTVRGILIGEVWLCTGSSNIFWPVSKCTNAKQEIATASYPQIRFFTAGRSTADQPQADCVGSWVACSPETVASVSGAGYFFVRRLHQELGVPIGMLQSYWGGSRIEAWTSLEALRSEPALGPILTYWDKQRAEFDAARAAEEHARQLAAWKAAVKQARSNARPTPAKPATPQDPTKTAHRPACLFNGMIAPLIPFGLRGAITYQGLGNLFWAEHSHCLLKTMLADWRSRWGQGDFPVGMIQPAPYAPENWAQSAPDAYSVQRESQLLVLQSVPHVGLAPTMDIDATNVLHFPQKQPVGTRLAQWALVKVHGRAGAWSGPVYQSMSREGRRVRIQFAHAESGLTTRDGKPPSHFTLAGPDRVFHPAEARIDGSTIVVQSEQVAEPVAVRFAWGNIDVPNLTNREGWPASLFRSDRP